MIQRLCAIPIRVHRKQAISTEPRAPLASEFTHSVRCPVDRRTPLNTVLSYFNSLNPTRLTQHTSCVRFIMNESCNELTNQLTDELPGELQDESFNELPNELLVLVS